MILLDATTKSLEVLLSAVVSTQLPILTNWIDIGTTGTDAVTGVSDTTLVTNDTTAVTGVAAPAASTTRQVKFVAIRNVNSSTVTVKLQLNNSGTKRIIVACALSQDETLTYTDGIGFLVLNWNGEQKASSLLINLSSQVTGTLPVANGGTGDATLTAHGVLVGQGTSAVAVTTAGTAGQVLTSNGASADPTFQSVSGSSTKFTLAWSPAANQPPASGFMTLNTRNSHLVLEATAGSTDTAIFVGVIPWTYGGGDVTVYVHWLAKTATTGTIGWDATFERMNAANHDLDSDAFATAQTITAATVDGTSGKVTVTNVSITAGATGTDSVAAGDAFRLRIRNLASGTATGGNQIIAVTLKEN